MSKQSHCTCRHKAQISTLGKHLRQATAATMTSVKLAATTHRPTRLHDHCNSTILWSIRQLIK